jgi:class 3 adenylate cyclase
MFLQGWRAVIGEIRTQRACRRRSTPTFLFADLVGYTAVTEAVGDGAAPIWLASFAAPCAPSAATMALVRSSRWATA